MCSSDLLTGEHFGDHRDLHIEAHSFPTRRSSDLEQSADQAPKNDDPFGNWDLRREPSKRQTPSADDMNNVKKKDFDIFENQTNADDAGSDDQPPFFKQRRRQ